MNQSRVDYGNMCDQQRMEKLVEGVEYISMFLNDVDKGEYIDVCDWPGVTCSEDGVNVLEIHWRSMSLKGEMNLSCMPPMVINFNVQNNEITGTLDAAELPFHLKMITLSSNKFRGSVNWESLPPNVEYMYLSNNQFEGNVNLDVLPSSLKYFFVGVNKFTSVSGKKPECVNVYGIDGLNKINTKSFNAESDKPDIDMNDVKCDQKIISSDGVVDMVHDSEQETLNVDENRNDRKRKRESDDDVVQVKKVRK